MNPAKKTLAAAKNFVTTHKTAIAVVTTAVITTVVVRKAMGGALQEANEFIEQEGLTEKFIESTNVFDV